MNGHVIKIESHRGGSRARGAGGRQVRRDSYRARWLCGWHGKSRVLIAEARDDGGMHMLEERARRRAAGGPPS